MLPYLTDYENDRRLFRPRVVNAILVLLPFMVLYRATELWFSDMYWFDYMKHGHYGLMWAGLCLLSVRKPRFALVAAYGSSHCNCKLYRRCALGIQQAYRNARKLY